MLLLAKPPYLRWSVAALILIAAILWELSDRATEPIPFANAAIGRGDPIAVDDIEWRDIQIGAVEPADLADATALVDIREGDPLTSSVAGTGPQIPQGWWSVPVALPPGVPAGSAVRLTTTEGLSVDGIIAIAASSDQFGIAIPGAVAVPERAVDVVASSAASGGLLVVVAP